METHYFTYIFESIFPWLSIKKRPHALILLNHKSLIMDSNHNNSVAILNWQKHFQRNICRLKTDWQSLIKVSVHLKENFKQDQSVPSEVPNDLRTRWTNSLIRASFSQNIFKNYNWNVTNSKGLLNLAWLMCSRLGSQFYVRSCDALGPKIAFSHKLASRERSRRNCWIDR